MVLLLKSNVLNGPTWRDKLLGTQPQFGTHKLQLTSKDDGEMDGYNLL